MNISEWLKDKHDEKKRQRAELRVTQAREEGRQEGWREGILEGLQEVREEARREGREEGRQEGRREVMEWYESKKNDPTNNDPPPWINLSGNS